MPHPPGPCGIGASVGSPSGKRCSADHTPGSTWGPGREQPLGWGRESRSGPGAIVPWKNSPRPGVVVLVTCVPAPAQPRSPEASGRAPEEGLSSGLLSPHAKETSVWLVSSAGGVPLEWEPLGHPHLGGGPLRAPRRGASLSRAKWQFPTWALEVPGHSSTAAECRPWQEAMGSPGLGNSARTGC